MRRLAVIILVLICAYTCKSPLPLNECDDVPLDNCNITIDEEYSIVKATILHLNKSKWRAQLLQESLRYSTGIVDVAVDSCGIVLDSLAYQDWIVRSGQPNYWCENDMANLELINQEEINCLYQGEYGDESYYAKYPRRFTIGLSRPYFDNNGQALIYLQSCRDASIVLNKVDGEWKIVCETTISIC